MSITVNVEGNQNIRVAEQLVGTAPSNQVEFAAEGTITVTPALLERFEGASLQPAELELAVADSETVVVDLSGAASLYLETVDVGVETPGTGDLSPGTDAIGSSTNGGTETSDTQPGAIAFTVEGTIADVPPATLESLADASSGPTIATVTFAVEEPTRSDGGSEADVLLEIDLLGYGLAVYRDGRIDVGRGGLADDVGLL
ncbi:hypothetical protein [Halopiger xanaduensis]|uniref:Uncharacterized protein n=1 Tax=Halopiger xanaduensis (strain DSM 18323 / JCM 14033 / SH-6) TaxID=797210 RepID=F8DCY8_HALXS|nr:hypothetical protein [Halopiger xanaduensis]AEH38456.1 hypothetical protein Halxa_3851 [Halopiger xanaduensis SH-6]